MREKIHKLGRAVFIILLLALSVMGALKTIYISADIDESYTVTMACRLLRGDRLFLDMWELHQTSAVLYTPFVWAFFRATGSVAGLVIFLRIIGIFIQGILAGYLFFTCRHYMSRFSAFILAVLFFNYTPKHLQSPDYTQICYWGFALMAMALLQFYIRKESKKSIFDLVLSAAGLCVVVLSYPMAVFLLFPVLAVIAILTKQGIDGSLDRSLLKSQCIKNMLIFTGSCIFGALLFLFYVLRGTTLKGMIETIPYILMDESHDQAVGEHIKYHILYIWDMAKITLIMIGTVSLFRLVWKKWKQRETKLFDILLLFSQAVYYLVQFHTIQKVSFHIFFPIILQSLMVGIYFYVTYKKTEKDRAVFYALIVPNLFLIIAILLSSNLAADYGIAFLFPGALAGCYMIGRIFMRGEAAVKGVGRLTFALFGIVLIGMVFTSRIFLVRYTGTQRKNIFEPNYETNHGLLAGIRLGDNDYRQYEGKTASLYQHVTKDDVFLYVGSDLFLYGETDALIGTGNTISTPAFGSQLFAYYEKFPERIPTVIFIDCDYVMDYRVWLEEEPFKSFIRENYEGPLVEGYLYIYKQR